MGSSPSYCSRHPKLAGGVEHLQPPWRLPSLNTWWVRWVALSQSRESLVVFRPGEWGGCRPEVGQSSPRVCHGAVVGFDASGGHWSPLKGSGGRAGTPRQTINNLTDCLILHSPFLLSKTQSTQPGYEGRMSNAQLWQQECRKELKQKYFPSPFLPPAPPAAGEENRCHQNLYKNLLILST